MIHTDFHTHCLPLMDDGSESVEMSLEMLRKLKEQNIDTVVASSHFYPQHENVKSFLQRRNESFETIKGYLSDLPIVLLGAEVNVVRRISETDLSSLCIAGTNFILLEMPYGIYESWVCNEIESIMYSQKLFPIIAHLDRYLTCYATSEFNSILTLPEVIYQINVSAFEKSKSKKFVMSLAEIGFPLVFGTDAHNLTTRSPDFSNFEKVCKNKRTAAIFQKTVKRSNRIIKFGV